MYGIAISNNGTRFVGMITPDSDGFMCRSSSCRFMKYQGAFDGFGVWSGFAISFKGALNATEQIVMTTMVPIAIAIAGTTI